jgi:UDP-N-acetylglucosamine:LPS N-acetylglucosamine transferase
MDATPKVLAILGEGGHTKEILILVDLMGPAYRYEYVVTHQDPLSAAKIRIAGPIHRVTRPRSKDDNAIVAAGKLLRCALQALGVLRRSRPDALLTSGPALAVPFAFWARLLGVRVIFVETGSRVRRLSLTGRLMRPLAHLFFVQWPQLREQHPAGIYAGRLC